jgi:hypothetical protein
MITPNFWCSEEYFIKSGFVGRVDNHSIKITDMGQLVFPSINLETGELDADSHWASFPGMKDVGEFLDYNFIYDPKDFMLMEGKKWSTFRKNSRKFPRRKDEEGIKLYYTKIEDIPVEDMNDVLLRWLEDLGDEEIHDPDVLLSYLKTGKNKAILLDEKSNIYGINIWDENYKFINYRYCVCKKSEFISEYMRRLFYTHPDIYNSGKLVNDGGSLDKPKLFKFKNRLNPVKIYKIYSGERYEIN